MLKKSSAYGNGVVHSPHIAEENENNKKQKIITWDEVTIAEHDKERGTRQKVDEAPTPYRYLSESDQSEAESGSDGEHLFRSHRGNSLFRDHDQTMPMGNLLNSSNDNILFHHPPTGKHPASDSLMNSLDTLHAKLEYEKHLQDLQQQLEESSFPPNTADAMHEEVQEDDDGVGGASMNTYNMDVANYSKGLSIDVPPPPPALLPNANHLSFSGSSPRHFVAGSHPVRSAIKKQNNSSNNNLSGMNNNSPTKQFYKRSEKPHKSVFIKPTHHEIYYTTLNSNQNSPVPSSSSAAILPTTATVSTPSSNAIPTTSNDSLFAGIHNTANFHEEAKISVDGSGSSYTYGMSSVAPSNSSSNNNSSPPSGEHIEQFRNKRAGHYNEYKVLLEMRAKLAAEQDDDEDDEDCDEENGNSSDEDDARTETSTTSSVGGGSQSSNSSKHATKKTSKEYCTFGSHPRNPHVLPSTSRSSLPPDDFVDNVAHE